MIDSNLKIQLNPMVLIKKNGGSFFLYNKENEMILELNMIGMEIAEKVQTAIYFQDIAKYFSDKYNVAVEDICADIEDFVGSCLEKRFFIYQE